MDVMKGILRIKEFWPKARFKMLGQERLDVMHRRLHELAQGEAPQDLRELILRMDEVGLGVRGEYIILAD